MQQDVQMPDNISELVWMNFLQGDSSAFAEIYNMYADGMFAYGSCFIDDAELVKDAIHDIFLRLYNNRTSVLTDNLKFYLLRAVKNEMYGILRNKKEFCEVEENFTFFSPVYSVEDMYIENEEEASLKKEVCLLLNSLTSRQKEVIYYRYMENLSIQEIAGLMDMNYQSVQNLIQRSMEHLRKIYMALPEKSQIEMRRTHLGMNDKELLLACLFFLMN
ncbi:sigma-70 family RNA polymerase sigma factor [Parabacteroides sp. W1-Q-101]|nr:MULTISPECIES: sigma-70 family RNA polymerase sigma factor [unclassified Parabacteroides]MCM0721752.1 sigma-70 family RNA polymerase sigma factor [Parabacteroides sp. W1-Q-101]